jgi:hypothetical protein
MKEDALEKGLPVPDEAAVRDRILKQHVEAPDLATVKDFLRFHAATSKGRSKRKNNLRLAQHICGVVLCRLQPCYRYSDKRQRP